MWPRKLVALLWMDNKVFSGVILDGEFHSMAALYTSNFLTSIIRKYPSLDPPTEQTLSTVQRECGPEGWLQGNKVTDDNDKVLLIYLIDIVFFKIQEQDLLFHPPTALLQYN